MIELGKAGGKFSAAASRPGHNSQRFCHLDILVGAVTFLADDGLNICRITLCVKMLVGLYIPFFQPVYELVDSRGILVARDDYAVYLQVMFAENINKPGTSRSYVMPKSWRVLLLIMSPGICRL